MRSLLFFDGETVGRPDAAQFLVPPEADKRLTDPVKIEKDLAEKSAKQLNQLGLDWNLNQIIALATATTDGADPIVHVADSCSERDMLTDFWRRAEGTTLVGYRSRTFDIPVILQRSRLLNVKTPANWRSLLGRFGKASTIDLYDDLTFDDMPATSCTPRTLKLFCALFGCDVDDDIVGAEIQQLVIEQRWTEVRTHCRADVIRVRNLAQKLGIL